MLFLWTSLPQPIGEQTHKTFLAVGNFIWPAWHTMINGTVPSNPRTFYYHYYVPWIRTPIINGLIYSLAAVIVAVSLRLTRIPIDFSRSPNLR